MKPKEKKKSLFNTINKNSTTDAPLAGMTEVGNIKLSGRPKVKLDEDGNYGTIKSLGVNFGDGETLIPTIYDGKQNTDEAAVKRYKKKKKHLGKFKTSKQATAAGEYLSRQQGKAYDTK